MFSDQVLDNLIDFFDAGIIDIGGFFNVTRAMTDKAVLTPADDRNFTAGQVWESIRGNWIWQTGVSYNVQPTVVTGIYINNIFSANNNSLYYVNYADGQIVFNTAVATTSKIEVEFSYRRFNFYDADNNWFRDVVIDPLDEPSLRSVLAKNRVYLPAVIVEMVPNRYMEGYELGDFATRTRQDILFHILAERAGDRNKLMDIITYQYNKSIKLYDLNAIADNDDFPLDERGATKSNAKTYHQMVATYPWKTANFHDIRSQEISTQLKLFRAVVRVTLELYLP
jgi:hypothetical protein